MLYVKERNFNMRTKRFGFTLAEVLITLGIIGVVAAMTIPTLISNTNSAKFKSQYKKTLSTLNQAALMATAQYDLDYASITGGDEGSCTAKAKPDSVSNICALINGTLSGATWLEYSKLNVAGQQTADKKSSYAPKIDTISTGNAFDIAYQLADGSMIALQSGMAGCTLDVGGDITALSKSKKGEATDATEGSACVGFIDVNGTTLPNKEVSCGGGGTTAIASSVGTCVVRNNATDMGDIFPVVFHDGTVEPITNAARYVLNQSK